MIDSSWNASLVRRLYIIVIQYVLCVCVLLHLGLAGGDDDDDDESIALLVAGRSMLPINFK